MQLFIYATYWVCTVVSTVGYGDYTGGTTLEYLVSIAIEFFGFIIFALIQFAVLSFTEVNNSYETYVEELDFQALVWFNALEAQNDSKKGMPAMMHEEIKKYIYTSYRENYSTVLEYSFFDCLKPKMQNEVIDFLFMNTKLMFSDFF